MSQRLVTLAGTRIQFVELDKPLKCCECKCECYFIDLDFLNSNLKPLCAGCSLVFEELIA